MASVAVAAAAVLLFAVTPAEAAGNEPAAAEIASLRAEMQALAARLDRLEAENQALQAENRQLKAALGADAAATPADGRSVHGAPEPVAPAAAEPGKVAEADWASRIRFSGDFRLRGEQIAEQRVVQAGEVGDAATDYRSLIRARAGIEARVTDNSRVVLRLATDPGDPRSANVTLGDDGSQKSIGLDLAYADWSYMPGGHLRLGKMEQPFWKPGQSLFFDGEYNPEGIATTVARGPFFGSAYGWWLEQNYDSNPAGDNQDTFMAGVQAGLGWPLPGGDTRLAVHYYDLIGGRGSNPFYDGNAYGNTTEAGLVGGSTTQVLVYDYDVVMLSGEFGTDLGGLPLAVWFDYAQNTAHAVDAATAWAFGAMVGKASAPRSWEAGVLYQSLDKDALFAQMVDADFGGGDTDADGWVLRAGYAPARNITLDTALYFNTRTVCGSGNSPGNQQCGPGIPRYELDYQRLQLDVNYRF